MLFGKIDEVIKGNVSSPRHLCSGSDDVIHLTISFRLRLPNLLVPVLYGCHGTASLPSSVASTRIRIPGGTAACREESMRLFTIWKSCTIAFRANQMFAVSRPGFHFLLSLGYPPLSIVIPEIQRNKKKLFIR